MAPADLLCPDGCAWLDQLTSVFDGHETGLVDMPLAEDNWGCPSTLAFGYTDTELVATGAGGFAIWGYPGGIRDVGGDLTLGEASVCTFSGASTYNCGSIVSADPGTINGCMAGYLEGGTTNLNVDSTTVTAITFPNVTRPVILGKSGASTVLTGCQVRTVAYGIRVSYIGKLSDTEGFVDFVSPPEYTTFNVTGGTMTENRPDASFRRHFFGVERTHTFYWTPNCDEVKYMQNYGNTKHAGVTLNSRFMLRIDGVETGDKFLVEVAAIQGFTGNRTANVVIPRPVSVDSQHIINTLQVHRGAHHPTSDKADRKPRGARNLKAIAAGHKARSTPALQYITQGANFVMKHWDDIEKAGAAGAKALGKVAALLI